MNIAFQAQMTELFSISKFSAESCFKCTHLKGHITTIERKTYLVLFFCDGRLIDIKVKILQTRMT